ncbi:polysaccharide biosynthesis C-terminal domain-containing protein [Devosia oryziradicis]|uniref:Polysaccharide biosynthesis C-terminal domain-containing protein n=1 Tax=Devosia oryziradicis TaxID=2801335 RepID=A0ABX7BYT4_9HYPH|nr:polysaccharide biosynthesis C-terminal domain-containing protein [Devosia oryziradicis]QQR37115.1 polysaccharide biosynthesis C-terminal domain-containing protein [Devosia oryziradicis]
MLLRSTLIYAPAILLTRLSALLLLAIATRLVDQTEYGLLTLVVTIGEMTDVAVTNWLRIALLRLGGKGEVSRGSLLLAGRVLVLSTMVALVASAAASTLVAPDRWLDFALAVGAYLVAGAVGRFALTVLQMQQRHSTYSMLEFLRAGLQIVLPVVAILLVPGTFLSISLGSSLGVLIAGLVGGALAWRKVVVGPARFTQREFFAFGVPLVVMALVGFGLNNAERLFLNGYYDAGAVAIFAAAYALARQPIDMVANAINMGAFPEVVGKFDAEGPAAATALVSRLMALMLRLCLPVAALLVALGPYITAVVLPPDYHGHVDQLFGIIAVSVLCANLTSFVYGAVVHAHKKPWLLVLANGAGSIGTIGLSVLLIPSMAETGAALALAGGTLASLAACIIISERLTPVPVPWRDIAVSLGIAAATGVAAALAGGGLRQAPALVGLIAGGAAGGAAFLALNALVHPNETRALTMRLRNRLRSA